MAKVTRNMIIHPDMILSITTLASKFPPLFLKGAPGKMSARITGNPYSARLLGGWHFKKGRGLAGVCSEKNIDCYTCIS